MRRDAGEIQLLHALPTRAWHVKLRLVQLYLEAEKEKCLGQVSTVFPYCRFFGNLF